MLRQNFAGRFTQAHCADGKDRDGGVKEHAGYKHKPSRNNANRSAIYKGVEIARRKWMQIDLEVPAKCKQRKNPKIIPSPDVPPKPRLPAHFPGPAPAQSILFRAHARGLTRFHSSDNDALPSAKI